MSEVPRQAPATSAAGTHGATCEAATAEASPPAGRGTGQAEVAQPAEFAQLAEVAQAAGSSAPITAPGAIAGRAAEPADAVADENAAEHTGPSLSPSRAGDFMTCPLLYRFRVIDRIPEPPSPAAARGTLVHAVLERLFDEPANRRTPEAARTLLDPQWERLTAEEPRLGELFTGEAERRAWLDEAALMLDRYFTLEDPTRIEPSHREMSVRALLASGLTLRGYIDRLDIARTGEIRIVDYKTGTAPREEYEARALFQMKFYAVVLWRTMDTIPRMLQLIYLGNGEIVRYTPDEADLLATERKINALWQAIDRARTSGDWRPRQSRLCEWCSYQALCPVFGGTPPPLPAAALQEAPSPAPALQEAPSPAAAFQEAPSPAPPLPGSAAQEAPPPAPLSPAPAPREPPLPAPASPGQLAATPRARTADSLIDEI
ncbi:MAG TPA: PD-(D/E)XK nuclease family protein [Streptosporangiaceae bacterium]|nr:PD-(D/E)XK nuclease family protein [Streptosporangiaceae bacterium]